MHETAHAMKHLKTPHNFRHQKQNIQDQKKSRCCFGVPLRDKPYKEVFDKKNGIHQMENFRKPLVVLL